MGQALAPIFTSLCKKSVLVNSQTDNIWTNPTNSNNLVTNPLFLGSIVPGGAGNTGFMATDWTSAISSASSTILWSVAPANSGVGQKMIATITVLATGKTQIYCPSASSKTSLGKTVKGAIRYTVVSSTGALEAVDCQVGYSGGTFGALHINNPADTSSLGIAGAREYKALSTPSGILQGGLGSLYLNLFLYYIGTGTIVIEFEQASLRVLD